MTEIALLLATLLGPLLGAGEGIPVPVAPNADQSATVLVLPAGELADAWMELTHLASDAPPLLLEIGERTADDGPLDVRPPLPPGPTMICLGGVLYGVTCEVVLRGAGEVVGPLSIELAALPGVALTGQIRVDRQPVEGAGVALVPVGLDAPRPFTMPLEKVGGRLVREVETDADGRFELPRIATGEGSREVFLEIFLPSGHIHRSEVFEVRTPAELLAAAGVEGTRQAIEAITPDGREVLQDLGRIDLPGGLDLLVRTVTPDGAPVAGAAVVASQGETTAELRRFGGISRAAGEVRLSGLLAELPLRLECSAPGYVPAESDHQLLPVEIDCVLEPFPEIVGAVVGPDGSPPPGSRVAARPAGASGEELPGTPLDDDGTFALLEVQAGEIEITAAAPGHRVERRTVTAAPGERLDLGTLRLRAGRDVDGVVVDAESGDGIAGVEIMAVDPPGAAATASDADGTFTVSLGDDRPILLRFQAPDYAPRDVEVTPEETAAAGRRLIGDPLRIALEEAGFLLVVIDNADGEPCRGCRVVIWPEGEELFTDGNGEALSGPLAPGQHRVARPRIDHLGSTVVEQPDADVHQAVVRSGRISVTRLRDAGETVRIVLDRPLDALGPLLTARSLTARSLDRTARLLPEPDGSFLLPRRDGETLDLFLGFYDATAAADTRVWQAILPASLRNDELRLRLPRTLVTGRAINTAGPIAGASVIVRRFDAPDLRAFTRTGADGRFRLPQLPPGIYRLWIGPRPITQFDVREAQIRDLGTFELPHDR